MRTSAGEAGRGAETPRPGGWGAPHTVNADGNLVAKGADSLQYDQANRLVSATINGQTTTFAYDGDGKRTRKVAGGQTTNYTYDVAAGLPVLLEDGQRKYVWGRSLLYATNPAGDVLRHVYQRDGLGTVRALTDGAGG